MLIILLYAVILACSIKKKKNLLVSNSFVKILFSYYHQVITTITELTVKQPLTGQNGRSACLLIAGFYNVGNAKTNIAIAIYKTLHNCIVEFWILYYLCITAQSEVCYSVLKLRDDALFNSL